MSTDPTPQILKRYYYSYDPAGNRLAEQIDDVHLRLLQQHEPARCTEAGGALVFKGTVYEPANVTIAGRPAP